MNPPLSLAPSSAVWRSNLGVALFFLETPRRRDALLFYRFCRAVDDVADDGNRSQAERLDMLERWSVAVEEGLPGGFEDVVCRRGIPREWLQSLIRGCRTDVVGRGFETWDGLECYCHDVASTVGMVCARIFGCDSSAAMNASARLGLGLQLVNIARDFRSDAAEGRCYIPAEFLRFHGLNEAAVRHGLSGRPLSDWICRARGILNAVDFEPADFGPMLPARLMRLVYLAILRKIEAGRTRVGLSTFEKLVCVAGVLCERPSRR
jgi:phytoene synthase